MVIIELVRSLGSPAGNEVDLWAAVHLEEDGSKAGDPDPAKRGVLFRVEHHDIVEEGQHANWVNVAYSDAQGVRTTSLPSINLAGNGRPVDDRAIRWAVCVLMMSQDDSAVDRFLGGFDRP